MCGILGFVNAVNTAGKTPSVSYHVKADDFISQGLVVSSLRGMDSTGVFQVDGAGVPYMYKLPVQASMFIQDKNAKQFIRATNRVAMTVCHVRAATEGSVSLSNAHPFSVNHPDNQDRLLMGVHNGTLTGWKSHKEARDYDVDSEWAMGRLVEEGRKALTDTIRGAYSFVWWDNENPMRLWFARNSERPLALARTKNKKHIMFASEPDMLALLAGRNGIEIEETIYITGTNQMYYVDVDQSELILEPFGEKYQEPAYGRPFVQSGTGSYPAGTNVTSINRGGSYHSSDPVGFFSRIDAWLLEVEKPKQEDAFRAPTAADRSDDVDYSVDAYTAADTSSDIIEVPFDVGELPSIRQTEYHQELADASEILEAQARGLLGTAVVFEADDSYTSDGVCGAVRVVATENHPDYDPSKSTGNSITKGDAIFLATGDQYDPTNNMFKGKKVIGVIAGVKSEGVACTYMLSPLKSAGYARIKKDIDLYLEGSGHAISVPATNVH